jgi:hypothetical protein
MLILTRYIGFGDCAISSQCSHSMLEMFFCDFPSALRRLTHNG